MSMRAKEITAAWLFLLPNLLGFLAFTLLPVLCAVLLGFTRWDLYNAPVWVGLDNYERLFHTDDRFVRSFWNTVYYVGVQVPVGIVIAMGAAILLNRKIRGVSVYRAIFFFPVITSFVATAAVWRWVFNPQYGPINTLLQTMGAAKPPMWLASQTWAMPAIIIITLWFFGTSMVLFLAGLQNIPQDLYEAAEIDGATKWQATLRITVPLLSPTTFMVTVLSLIWAFKSFEPFLILTDGGPAGSTSVLVFYIYELGFRFYEMGYASAAAVILFLIIFTITAAQWLVQQKWLDYS